MQLVLAAGAIEWVLTAYTLAQLRLRHDEPYVRLVFILGGVAVFLGWFVGVTVSQFIGWHLGVHWQVSLGDSVHVPLPVVIGAFLVVLLGLYDDIFHISPYWKIAGQVLAAAIAGQFPDKFPTTQQPSDTAMAPASGPNPAVLIGLGLASLAVLSLTRRAIEVRSRT